MSSHYIFQEGVDCTDTTHVIALIKVCYCSSKMAPGVFEDSRLSIEGYQDSQ